MVTIVIIALSLWLQFRRPISQIIKFSSTSSTSSLPTHQGRTNFLLLGIGGDAHDGPDLTDTIFFVSISHTSGQTVILSLPRDLWIPSLRAKINTAYHYGRQKSDFPGGLLLAKSAVSEIINQPVDFVIVINFDTFSQIIDLLGGIDVQIDRSFTDTQYPIAGKETDPCDGDIQYKCRYETVTFTAGQQHLNGQQALKFVRSRHSSDPQEGTDFARSRRQELVLLAVKTKLLALQTLKQPQIYTQIYTLLSQNVTTDITPDHHPSLFKLLLHARSLPYRSAALAEPDQLSHPPVSSAYDYQWVLTPKNNQPQIVYDFVSRLTDQRLDK